MNYNKQKMKKQIEKVKEDFQSSLQEKIKMNEKLIKLAIKI